MISIVVFLIIGTIFKLMGYTKIAYVIWAITVLVIGDICIKIKRHGSYKAWKVAEKVELENYEKKIEKEKKEQERLEAEAAKTMPKAELVGNKDTYMLEKYKKRQAEARKSEGLFYPDIGDYEIPTGWHDIPVPSYVAYDLETTGLTPTHDEILEIGAIRIVNGDITGVFHEYVYPSCSIPASITKINGITDDMVKNCRNIDEVLPDFIAFTERLPMVSYNTEFDYTFLKETQLKINGKKFTRKHYCAMKTYIKYYKDINLHKPYGYKLSDAVRDILGPGYYKKFTKENHKALVDTSAAQFIFEAIGGVWHN